MWVRKIQFLHRKSSYLDGYLLCCCCHVCQVMSSSLQLHGLQCTRLPCSPLSPGVCVNSGQLSQWCYLNISSCHPLLLPSIFPSIRVFSIELALCISWPKYWSFSFSISHSNEYSGLLSFRTDWFDLLAVQGTLKNLLQHHNLKASILQLSAYFVIQLSYSYMTTGVNSPVEWKGIPLI